MAEHRIHHPRESNMKGILALTALASLLTAVPAAAQVADSAAAARDLEAQVQVVVEQSGVVPALESVVTEVGPELHQALARLAVTFAGVGERMANDPEVRESALRGAEGMVQLAQVVVEERSDMLIEVLRGAADQLEKMSRRAAEAEAGAEGADADDTPADAEGR
jgi:hypothetical protein